MTRLIFFHCIGTLQNTVKKESAGLRREEWTIRCHLEFFRKKYYKIRFFFYESSGSKSDEYGSKSLEWEIKLTAGF